MLKDTDRDGVPNINDCYPFDKKRQTLYNPIDIAKWYFNSRKQKQSLNVVTRTDIPKTTYTPTVNPPAPPSIIDGTGAGGSSGGTSSSSGSSGGGSSNNDRISYPSMYGEPGQRTDLTIEESRALIEKGRADLLAAGKLYGPTLHRVFSREPTPLYRRVLKSYKAKGRKDIKGAQSELDSRESAFETDVASYFPTQSKKQYLDAVYNKI